MKKKFSWYLNPTADELDHAWKNGILTVDANVLLDLYRYHEDTRLSLIESLQKFEGEKWISNQAAVEFFRNRTKVIISSEKAFKHAQDETGKLKDALLAVTNQLKGNRIIPTALAQNLQKEVDSAINNITSGIDGAKAKYPQFLQHDPILEKLLEIFDDAVGDDFPEGDKQAIAVAAESRKKSKIPPGYLDDEKDEDRPYGDYYLWMQVLKYAKSKTLPVILVTSERKEDWWEKISGKTVGPRPELIREGHLETGQRVLIYQTEKFLEHAQKRLKQPVNDTAIEEIRAVGVWRAQFEAAIKLLEQSTHEASPSKNRGILSVELRRPVRNFTVSGHLSPNMHNVPQLTVRLLSAPDTLPAHKLGAGTGTTHDFNIHVTSVEYEVRLPIGLYTLEYEATCEVKNAPDIAPDNAG